MRQRLQKEEYLQFLLPSSVLNVWMTEEILEGLKVSSEDNVEAKQADVQQMVPAIGENQRDRITKYETFLKDSY